MIRRAWPGSGIMVDGADVGTDITTEGDPRPTLFSEGFRDADLCCIIPEEHNFLRGAESPDPKDSDKTKRGFMMYALYGGNKIVTTFVPSTWIEAIIKENASKVVLVRKKPYLLNGVSSAS